MSFFKQLAREILKSGSPFASYEPVTSYRFSDEFCKASISIIEKCRSDKIGEYFSNGSDYRVFYINDLLASESELSTVIKDIIPTGWFVGPILGAHLKATKNSLGSGEGWHRDSWFGQKKLMIYLTDVGLENGPFQYIPKSSHIFNKLKSLLKGEQDRLRNQDIDTENVVSVTGKLGTSCIFDGTMVHRGKPPTSGERYALTVYLYSGSYRQKDIEKYFAQR